MRVTNKKINFLSKGHSTQEGSKIPFISNLKKPACASKQDVLELATLRYISKSSWLQCERGVIQSHSMI